MNLLKYKKNFKLKSLKSFKKVKKFWIKVDLYLNKIKSKYKKMIFKIQFCFKKYQRF